jgi:hypothetical protein
MPIFLGNKEIGLASLGSLPVSDIKQQAPLNIGDYAFGGIIIKLDGTFPNYTGGIVAALNDAYTAPTFPYVIWGCSGTTIGTSAAVGSGGTNTAAILAGCGTRPIFASLADDYTEGGYSDWVLPSEGEAGLISTYRALIPNLTLGARGYVTSTEGNTVSTQFRVIFLDGGLVLSRSKSDNTISNSIRCVRYFTIP